MSEETTTEQLAEIEGQAESTPATGYTPPEGWRVLRSGELLQPGDHWVNWEGNVSRPDIQHGDGATVSGGRYIRWVKPQPQSQPEPQPESQPESQPIQVREGWWRTRGGEVYEIQRMHESQSNLIAEGYAWKDTSNTHSWCNDGSLWNDGEQSNDDLVEYCGLIKPEMQQVNDWPSVTELRHQLKTVQNQLAAVKAELVTQAETSRRLQIELDAAQQVPADSPEIRQLRADLEQMTLGRDTYRDGYDRVLSDLVTARKTAKAEAIEAIVEWLVPIRTCGSQALAAAVISNLPHIMRSLTGLEDEEIE